MRTIFMGAPQFAVPSLERLINIGVDVVGVYTKAPKPAGRRGLEITKTPVHKVAESFGLPVHTPVTLKSREGLEEFRAQRADVAIVAAYGLILPPDALMAPSYGCLNLHGSLLPRWRGAAPIQRAIMAGDERTGVALMRMEAGLDTGPIAREFVAAIEPHDTAGDLTERIARLAADLLEASWSDLVARRLAFEPQRAVGITYARKIEKSEGIVDWRADAVAVRNHIHGLSPHPGAFSAIQINGQLDRIKFLRVEAVDGEGAPGTLIGPDFRIACGSGAIRALEVQRAGKPPVNAEDALRGARIRVEDRFLSFDELRNTFGASA
jgi:methionyl-tRNA formyltransferase